MLSINCQLWFSFAYAYNSKFLFLLVQSAVLVSMGTTVNRNVHAKLSTRTHNPVIVRTARARVTQAGKVSHVVVTSTNAQLRSARVRRTQHVQTIRLELSRASVVLVSLNLQMEPVVVILLICSTFH